MISIRQTSVRSGRIGGQKRTSAKTLSAKQNILLRWHPRDKDGTIPVAALVDGAWYLGSGRTAPIALWDSHAGLFRTISIQTWPDPANYPATRRRISGLKSEKHIQSPGGTFSPKSILAQ
jgi:hypothetical protein